MDREGGRGTVLEGRYARPFAFVFRIWWVFVGAFLVVSGVAALVEKVGGNPIGAGPVAAGSMVAALVGLILETSFRSDAARQEEEIERRLRQALPSER